MTGTFSPPEWLQAVIALVVLAGAVVTFIGTVGLVRLATFYQRIHAPTLGTSMGTALILLASSLHSSLVLGRPVVHEVLILIMVLVTTPVTLVLLARAALYRDVAEGNPDVPALPRSTEDAPKP
ncbi:MAG: cation:proton antiporter [Devosia sp.]|uniref:monovalent cation/H(+) antiporter subunit G n=1 Tax=Devosia sp. TaxID=1871048 RepID=UPI001AD44945|nr:monovalent cation/H(+) antiporter subunit G [Devosia sp.]MBN9309289.1 cation:proton antiporter [Devosia sp.]MBN9314947.1 cation:proton antiporter [Devosia sp.]